MASPRILASGLNGGVGARFDPASNRIFYVEFGGTISSAALDGTTHAVLGTGYSEPEDIVLSRDGATAFVTERAGSLLKVSMAAPNRADATVVAGGLVAPQQIILFESANLAWVVEFNTLGRLIEIDLLTGSQTVLASGLQHAVGLAAPDDRSSAFVVEQAASGGRIVRIDLATATRTTIADGLTAPFFLAWTDASQSELLFTERDPANRVSILDLRTTPASRHLAALDVPFRPSSAIQVGRELVVCSDQSLVAFDITAGLPATVKIRTPATPLYVGSYRRLAVDLGVSGIGFDDLDFTVAGGREAGVVSPSRDATFDPSRPSIMLLAGYRPGRYQLTAIHRPTGAIVSQARFALTNEWNDNDRGPSKWFNGILPAYSASPTWGSSSGGAPQNFNTVPALGTKRVAVLFVDTSDQRYTTAAATLAGFRTRWQQHVADGVTGPDGVTRSVAQYYREVSYNSIGLGGMDVTVTIFPAVVSLPNDWTTYFQLDVNNKWQAKNEFINQCVTAAGNGVNLTGFDMIVCVAQAAGGAAPSKVAWPYGGYGVSVDSAHGRVTSRGISMPNEWGDGSANDQAGGRTIFETLAHEMGHTINLPDEYKPPVAGRQLAGNPQSNSSWDPMDLESNLPHFVLPHRMMLGWIQAPWIKLYNFLLSPGTQVDETVTLAAIEVVPPPVNQFSGIEIRIGDGRNYYAEYRRGQATQIGDELLAPNARIVLMDVSEPPDPPVIARPDILLLPKHTDDDGAVLDSTQFYHETDNTTPTFPSDFRLDVISFNGNQAVVRVRYGVIGKPDPSIRPWPRDAAHQWQSPDIEVNNARNAADSEWANVPWRGHDNTVVAQIKNRGSLSAPGVVANFFVKDYTIGGAPETLLGSDTHDIAPGATVAFTTQWAVPAPANDSDAQHFCIIVRIDPYETPTTPPVHELTDANNVAQSNYDRFISATSTPSREIAAVTACNPYPRTTRFFVGAGQSNPLYRTFVEHTWLRLNPKEQARIQVMFEFAPDAPQSDPDVNKLKERFLRLPNVVNMVGMIEDPGDARLHGPDIATGVTAVVVTGKSTHIIELKASGERVAGQVFTKDAGPVPSGAVIITTRDKNRRTLNSVTGKVGAGGAFVLAVRPGWATLETYYAGAPGYADCEAHIQAP